MIIDVPRIKVSGIDYPIYAADFSWGGADGPSKLVIDYVNTSNFVPPNLTSIKVSVIEIGDFFSFEGYPVSWNKRFSNNGNLVSVTYWDTSIILDKIYVGLKGMHGSPPSPIQGVDLSRISVEGTFDSQHLVLVGNYVDPCESVTSDYIDTCNPCITQEELSSLSEANSEKKINCNIERYTRILDVTYTFAQLAAGLSSKGVQFSLIPYTQYTYYGRYTGTAREVLKSWCQDLGLTFYWKDDAITFVNLQAGIDIADTNFYTDCALMEKSESQSIENNYSTGNIFYFGGEGELKTYNCSKAAVQGESYRMSLLPITLKDLFSLESGDLNPYIQKYYTNTVHSDVTGLQKCCVAAYYTKMMRDMMVFYHLYGVTDVSAIDIPNGGGNFPLLGMKIKKLWDVTATPEDDSESKMKELFWNHIPETMRKRATIKGGAMAIIEWNPDMHDRFYNFEKTLANDFIGKYWMSYFSKGDRYNYSAPDGNVEYFDAGTPLSLPFLHVIPDSIYNTSAFLQQMINNSAQKNADDAGYLGEVTTNNPNSFAYSFLFMERSAAWEPPTNTEDSVNFGDSFKDMYFYAVEPFKIEGTGDELKENEYYALLFDMAPNAFQFTSELNNLHPIENGNVSRELELDNFHSTYGLRSDRNRKYNLQINITKQNDLPAITFDLDAYMPVQSFEDYGGQMAGYTIVATKNSSTGSDTKVFLERKEMIIGSVPFQGEQAIGVIINFKDITSTVQSIISTTSNSCEYDEGQIRYIMKQYEIGSSRPKQITSITKSYTLAGFPTRILTIEDGLSGISIRYSSDSGISSSIEFSNTPPISKSDKAIDQEIEKNILKRLLGKRTLSSNNKVLI